MAESSVFAAAGGALIDRIKGNSFLKKLEKIENLDPTNDADQEQIELLYRFYEANSRYINSGHELVILLKHKYGKITRQNQEAAIRHLERQLLEATEGLEKSETANKTLSEKLNRANASLKEAEGKDGQIASLSSELEKSRRAVQSLEVRLQDAEEQAKQVVHLTEANESLSKRIADLTVKLEQTQGQAVAALENLSAEAFVKAFKKRMSELTAADFQQANHQELLNLVVALDNSFEANGLQPPSSYRDIPDHLRHLTATEAIIDHMAQAIKRVKNDENLDEDEKQAKLDQWEEIMEKQIHELLGRQ